MESPEFHPKTIVVIGTGYVGLPAAVLLARAGHKVIGVDIDENIVQAINEGILRVTEDELQKIMDEPEVRRNLKAQATPCEADAFLIAVPTPLEKRKKLADLSIVTEATKSIVPFLREGNLVILESTVPPLTCRNIMTPLLESSGLIIGKTLHLSHCPERILPGDVFYEIVHNDRIIGASDQKSCRMAVEIYSSFVEGELLLTDDVTAELVKLMENTYRDVNIALANELAAVARTLGVDGRDAIDLANRHRRVNILNPGIGVGGHCIPIDPWFIKEVDPSNSQLISTARLVNDELPSKVVLRIRKALREIPSPHIVAVGAAYKANSEDTRESPALEIVDLLRHDGYRVDHYDPLVQDMKFPSTITEACSGADCLLLLVEHDAVMREIAAGRQEIEEAMRHSLIMRF